jgi:hypothetical protein
LVRLLLRKKKSQRENEGEAWAAARVRRKK